MKICIISDVHANFPALESITDYLESADLVIGLGDYVGYYCFVNETLDFLRSLRGIFLLGNHDHFLLSGYPSNANESVKFGIDFAGSTITQENKTWLGSLPLVWGGYFAGKSFLLSHGSPWNPLGDYLYSDSSKIQQLCEFEFDFIAFGQTHRTHQSRFSRRLAFNPGSVGQSRSEPGMAEAVLLNTQSGHISFVREEYDWEKTLAHAISNGAGDYARKHFPL